MRILSGVSLVLFMIVVGCASTPDYSKMSPEEISQKVTIQSSKFDAQSTVIGPPIVTSLSMLSFDSVRLRSWKDASGRFTTSQFYILVYYNSSSWRFYESANLVGGALITAHVIDRQVSSCTSGTGCTYQETVAIDVPTAMLDKLEGNSMQFRLNAKDGTAIVIDVPSSYIKGFLLALRL